MTCELLGQMLSTLILGFEHRDEAERQRAIGERRVRLLERLHGADYLAAGLTADRQDLDGAPPLGPHAAGVLAVGLPQTENNALLWFRPAVETAVSWAGFPEKVYAEGPTAPASRRAAPSRCGGRPCAIRATAGLTSRSRWRARCAQD